MVTLNACRKLILLFCLLSFAGCCTRTGDPTKGGFWCWSEAKTIENINGLNQQKENEEQKLAREKEERRRLEAAAARLRSGIDDLREKVNRLSNEIEQKQKELERSRNLTAQKRKEIQGIQRELQGIRHEIATLKSGSGRQEEIDRKKNEIKLLNEDIERLLKIAAQL